MYEFGNSEMLLPGEKQDEENMIYARTIFGEDIRENPVPVDTADSENEPFAVIGSPDTGEKIGLNRDMLSQGLLALAAPGGGKTNVINLLLSPLLDNLGDNEIVINFDTKGDYLKEFGWRIPEQDRIIIGSGEAYRDITSYHNIFAEIMPRAEDGRLVYTEECTVDAGEIAAQLFQQMQSDTQPVFPAMAEQVTAGVIVYFMRKYWEHDQSMLCNRELLKFFYSATTEELKAVFELMDDYRSCISYIEGKNSMTQSVQAYIGAALRKMFIGPFRESDPTREFSMQDVVKGKGKKVVFIEYDLMRGNSLQPMYGLLIDSAIKYALGGRGSSRKNVYFVLDEWKLLPKLQHAADALSFGRDRGVKIIAGLQNISSVEEAYGAAGAKSILAGFQNLFAFKITDYDTRQYVVGRLGENYQNLSFKAQTKNVNVQRLGHTAEDWVLTGLGKGEAVVKLEGRSPFLFKLPKY